MLKNFILSLIRFYQKYLSLDQGWAKRLFLTDRSCRFSPTCSEYTYQAVDRYGVVKGLWVGIKRVVRCNPWTRGGHDPLD